MNYSDRISVNPDVLHGQAAIEGTRVPVHQVLAMLANGDDVDGLLQAYPSLKKEDILACLAYGARIAEEQTLPLAVPDE